MSDKSTDWNSYYSRPYKTASLTRKYTASVLTRLIGEAAGENARILELGGGNSCFIDQILSRVKPARYDVIDKNELSLDLLKARFPDDSRVSVRCDDILRPEPADVDYDVIFSVGLIEHFDGAGTAKAIKAHFGALRRGGHAIITFPTPTWLYVAVRQLAETTGNWIFHDERPLRLAEVLATTSQYGQPTFSRVLWPLILTQYCVAIRKSG